jgi:hypothetical protein
MQGRWQLEHVHPNVASAALPGPELRRSLGLWQSTRELQRSAPRYALQFVSGHCVGSCLSLLDRASPVCLVTFLLAARHDVPRHRRQLHVQRQFRMQGRRQLERGARHPNVASAVLPQQGQIKSDNVPRHRRQLHVQRQFRMQGRWQLEHVHPNVVFSGHRLRWTLYASSTDTCLTKIARPLKTNLAIWLEIGWV